MEPNRNDNSNGDENIFATIRSNAEVAQPPSSSSDNNNNTNNNGPTRRMITMYRSGFTIDDGPFRRLDDPSNADFLRDLARGMTPRELLESSTTTADASGDMEVGLIDKRHMEYEDDKNMSSVSGSISSTSATASTTATTTAAFSGVGQSLGSSSSATDGANASSSEGVITPSTSEKTPQPPTVDESKPTTTIQIRLLNGKRLILKCNLDDTILTLISHIESSSSNSSSSISSSTNESYVLSSGYPPRILNDLNQTIEEAGLKGAQVVQKKAP